MSTTVDLERLRGDCQDQDVSPDRARIDPDDVRACCDEVERLREDLVQQSVGAQSHFLIRCYEAEARAEKAEAEVERLRGEARIARGQPPEVVTSIETVRRAHEVTMRERDEARAACASMRACVGRADHELKCISDIATDHFYPRMRAIAHLSEGLATDAGRDILDALALAEMALEAEVAECQQQIEALTLARATYRQHEPRERLARLEPVLAKIKAARSG